MDQDVLKVLINIEKLLKGSSAFTEAKKLPSSADKARETSSQRAGREANKAFKATTTNLSATNDAVTGLNKSLVGLNTEVGRTTTGFGSLNSQMAKFMSSLVPLDAPKEIKPAAETSDLDKLLKSVDGMWGSITQMGSDLTDEINKVVHVGARTNVVLGEILTAQLNNVGSTNSVTTAIQALAIASRTPSVAPAPAPAPTINVSPTPVNPTPVTVNPPAVNVPAPSVTVNPPAVNVAPAPITVTPPVVNVPAPSVTVTVPPTPAPAPPPPIKPNAPQNPAGPALNSVMGRMIDNFSRSTTVMGGFTSAVSSLWGVVVKLTEDFLLLSSVGMGSSQNLLEMSKYALLSGMSLKEYQETISKNITAAARAGSLEEFNRTITASSAQLAKLGVYGITATQLQASLAQANTMMGVSQGALTGTISSQISVFDKLRKSTNMTAEEFGNLITRLSEQEQVQKELVGLAPQERAVRQAELIQIATTGQRLGLTAQASEKLADALIKQRGESVKNRFEQAGRIRQLGQLTGMGGEGERAAQIVMKGRAASATELEELRGIAGRLDASSQAAYENGNLGVQSAMDYFQETLGSSNFGQIMNANRPAKLAEDSGKVGQAAFGQHVGEFGQFVGKLTTFMDGFTKSVGPALLGAIGAGMLVLFKGPLAALMSSTVARFVPGAAGAVGSAVTAGAGAASSAPGVLSSIGSAISKLTAPISTLRAGINGLVPSMYQAGKATGQATRWVMDIPKGLRNAYNAVTLTNAISGPANTVKFMFQELGTTVMNGARGASTSVIQGTKSVASSMVSAGGSVLGSLKTVARGFAPAAMLIDAVMEAFTGDIAMALNPSGGFLNRVGGVITSAISAIPNFIIDAIGFVFGDSFAQPLQRGFDMIVTMANAGFRIMVGKLIEGIAAPLKWLLPEDSKLVKMLDGWSSGLAASADENFKTYATLEKDSGATLKKISESNTKSAEDSAKKATEATTKATAAQSKFNNVQYGTELTRAGVVNDAKTIIGEPQVQTPPPVNPGTVNKPEEAAKQQDAAKQAEQSTAALGGPEVLVALNAILAVMRENLVQEQRQAELAEQLVSGNRPAATFVPADVMASRLLNQRYS